MKRSPELKRELAEVRAQMQQIDQAANGGALEGEAATRWQQLDTRATELGSALDRADRIAEMERRAPANDTRDVRDAASRFNYSRAILGGMSRMGVDVARVDDGLEREYGQELRRLNPALPEAGIVIPTQRLFERRAISYGAGSGSGAGIQHEEYRPERLIEELRPTNPLARLGVDFLNGLQGAPVTLPVFETELGLTFAAEGSAFSAADPTLGKKSATPHIGAAFTSLSPITLAQPSAEQIVTNHLIRAANSGVARVAITGGVGAEPDGLTAILGAPTALGTPTWAEVLALIEEIENANVNSETLGAVVHPSAKRVLRSTPKIVYEGSPNPDVPFPEFIMPNANTLADMPAVTSTHVPTTGSPPSAAGLIVGDYSELTVCTWQAASVLLNPFSEADYLRGQIGARIMLLMDVIVKRPSAFKYATVAI